MDPIFWGRQPFGMSRPAIHQSVTLKEDALAAAKDLIGCTVASKPRSLAAPHLSGPAIAGLVSCRQSGKEEGHAQTGPAARSSRHSAVRRRYRLRRRAIDSVPFSSLVTGRASRSLTGEDFRPHEVEEMGRRLWARHLEMRKK